MKEDIRDRDRLIRELQKEKHDLQARGQESINLELAVEVKGQEVSELQSRLRDSERSSKEKESQWEERMRRVQREINRLKLLNSLTG